MQELIIYLLKSAGLLSLFFAGYFFLLKNDTSFRTNRIFLLAGIFTSTLLPFLEITRKVIIETTAASIQFEKITATQALTSGVQATGIDWWQTGGIIYLIGLGFFLLKFFLELFSLLKLIYTHEAIRDGNFSIIHKTGNTQPFSFFKFIVLDPVQHSPAERELILKHERSHAHQWHSVDQLLTSLCVYLLWFNPLAWLYRKCVVQNLEYLADKEVIATQVSTKEYQKTLLKISVGSFQPALTNQFYQSFIKKRIMMLNKNTPRKSNFWKVGAVLPFIFIFIINFNVTTEAQVKERTDNPLSEITNDEEIAVTISKNTPEEALLMYQRIFNKRGTRLEFKNLQYSENDLLIAVSVSYHNSKTDETGQISLNNPEGIPSTIIYSGDKKTGFRQPKNSGQPEEVMSGSTLSKLGENPVFVIENEMYPSEKLYGKYIQVDGEMQILETMEAIQQYGAQAADGVIIVTKGKIISDFDASIKEIDSNPNAVKRNFIQIERGQSPSFISLDKKADHPKEKEESPAKFKEPESRTKNEDIPAIHRENEEMKNSSFEGKRPLIVLEGEVKEEDFNLNSIDPNTIKSLSVLKGESALVKYGERAENGVVKIELLPDGEIVKEIEAKQSEELGRTPIPVTIITYDEPANNGSEVEIHNVQEADFLKSGALYIVDGKQKDENFDPATLDPNNIKNIDILKGAMAIEKYGEKGKHGVLEITMKKKSRI